MGSAPGKSFDKNPYNLFINQIYKFSATGCTTITEDFLQMFHVNVQTAELRRREEKQRNTFFRVI